MNIGYIREEESIDELISDKFIKFPKFIKKIIYFFAKRFNAIKIRDFKQNYIYIIPNMSGKTKKSICRLKNKLINNIEKDNIKNIVLSNKLEKSEYIKNSLYARNMNILDGRWLFKFLIIDIIKYICKQANKKTETMEVAILVNDNNEINLDNINKLSKIVKRVNIVTNNIEKFKKLENKLYDELGIMVTISNNKKKSLLKSNIIINVDFPEDVLKKYKINRESIIVNIENKVTNLPNSFKGVNINFYEIYVDNRYIDEIKEYNMFNYFNLPILYESYIYKNGNIKEIEKVIKNDNIQIKDLIGISGIINKLEYKV